MGGRGGGGFEVIQFLISTPTNYLQKYQIMDSPLTKSHSSIKHFTLAASTEEGRRGEGSDAEYKIITLDTHELPHNNN